MTYLEALILAIVEGLTEFLPVSSTGHLILASKLLAISQTNFVKSFEIAIQLGAILSVLFLYKEKFMGNFKVLKNVIIAFLPTAVVGFFLYKFIKDYLIGDSFIVSLSLVLGGIVLALYELNYSNTKKLSSVEKITIPQALLIGTIQSISVIPGVSRAASTILGGLIVGLDRKTAVEFSFFLAVPTIFGATALDIATNLGSFTQSDIVVLIIGFIFSFITAVIAIKFFVNFIKRSNFIPFAIYRIVVGIIFLLKG